MELQATDLGLGWGRAPDGRLAIGVSVGALPLYVFLLSPEEEQSLRAMLNGIVLPGPSGNPRMKLNLVEA